MRSTLATAGRVLSGLVLPMLLGCGNRGEPQPPATEVSVETGLVARATLHAWVDAYGTVEPAPAAGGKPAGGARLAAPVAGLVRSVPVSEGRTVRAGDVVVRLDDRAAQAAVDKASETLKRAELTLARERALLEQRNTSQKQVELAEEEAASARADLAAAQAQLAVVDLASPLAGVVTRIQVQPGQAVDLNSVVAEIVDLHRLVVSVPVPASEAALLRAARPVEIRLDDNTGEPAARGEVTFVSPSVDQKTGTALVRVALPADSASVARSVGPRSDPARRARGPSRGALGQRLHGPRRAQHTLGGRRRHGDPQGSERGAARGRPGGGLRRGTEGGGPGGDGRLLRAA